MRKASRRTRTALCWGLLADCCCGGGDDDAADESTESSPDAREWDTVQTPPTSASDVADDADADDAKPSEAERAPPRNNDLNEPGHGRAVDV